MNFSYVYLYVNSFISGNKRPELRDLNNYVVIKCATAWKELGENLKVDKNLLKIIGKDNPHSCENCCSKMLSEWLDLTPEASWGILLDAMQNLNLSTDITEDLHTSSLAGNNINIHAYVTRIPYTQ